MENRIYMARQEALDLVAERHALGLELRQLAPEDNRLIEQGAKLQDVLYGSEQKPFSPQDLLEHVESGRDPHANNPRYWVFAYMVGEEMAAIAHIRSPDYYSDNSKEYLGKGKEFVTPYYPEGRLHFRLQNFEDIVGPRTRWLEFGGARRGKEYGGLRIGTRLMTELTYLAEGQLALHDSNPSRYRKGEPISGLENPETYALARASKGEHADNDRYRNMVQGLRETGGGIPFEDLRSYGVLGLPHVRKYSVSSSEVAATLGFDAVAASSGSGGPLWVKRTGHDIHSINHLVLKTNRDDTYDFLLEPSTTDEAYQERETARSSIWSVAA